MKFFGLNRCLLAGCLLSLATAGVAETSQQTAPVPVRATAPATIPAQQNNPVAMLQSGIDKLLARLNAGHNAATLGGFLSREIAPSFDFKSMARSASGPLYTRMSDKQRARLEKKLEVMFLGSMADKLAKYSGQDVVFLPPRFKSFNRTSVSALINNPGQYPSRIDFRVHLTDDGWKVYDVAAGGQSAIAYYRSYFRHAMGNNRRG